MAASWSGLITYGLLGAPVTLHKAIEEHPGPSFYQVHATDGGRVKQPKLCTLDNKPIGSGELTKGLDLPDGAQIIVTTEDLQNVPIPSKHEIAITMFVDADSLNPLALDTPYYVKVAAKSPAKPYVLLREAMRRSGQVGIAKITLASRESLSVLRVEGNYLVLQTMHWPDELRPPTGIAPEEQEVNENEIAMALALMEALSEDIAIEALHDEYREAVEAVVQAKARGQKPPSAPEVPDVGEFSTDELLKRSIAQQRARRGKPAAPTRKRATTSQGATRKRAAAKTAAPAAKKTSAKKQASAPRRRKAG